MSRPELHKAARATLIVHGKTCPKKPHVGSGYYGHTQDDDTPYVLEGIRYCGRCHCYLPEELTNA